MRILVFGEQWSKFSAWLAFDHGAGDVLFFALLAVRVFERPDDQGPHRCTRLSRAMTQRLMQRLGNIYCRSHRHVSPQRLELGLNAIGQRVAIDVQHH